jgi:quinoprotein glucose dehydrogenase
MFTPLFNIKKRKTMKIRLTAACLIVAFFALNSAEKLAHPPKSGDGDWSEYLGGADRNHYSELTQINRGNVANLTVAWTYATADSGQMQTNPLVIDGVLYGVSPTVQPFALDAATGKELWIFGDPLRSGMSTSRGVAYWSEGDDKRILHTIGANLYCLDAKTGKPIPSFGDSGHVDLHDGLPSVAKDKFIISNTPGTIFEDLIVMPVRLSEGADAAPGDIRAFNVKTGKLAWTFHTIPYPNEAGYETFPPNAYKNEDVGAANNWAGMAVDKKRGILYVPTGSASADFYGGKRLGSNLYANCLLALNARTGERLWHFQTTHHDIWDRDLPAPPNLMTIKKDGKTIDVVAQVTKQGQTFVFDRVTGQPIFPIKEIKAPKSSLDGEVALKTQPVPTKPAPFARQAHKLTKKDISPYADNRAELMQRLKTYKTKRFATPSKEGTVIFPGFDGGAEWGGAAADPNEGILYVNSNEMAWILTMVETPSADALAHLPLGERIYTISCSNCHGPERKGNPLSNFPSLVDIGKRLDRNAINTLITNGKGMMPGLNLGAAEKQAVVDFLLGLEKKEAAGDPSVKMPFLPYKSTGYNKFLDSKGHPAISPPWGTLSAINLNTGNYLWQIPLGNEPDLAQKGTGTENYGGPVVTASGLLFIAATKDGMFRAFDRKTGKLLWETMLPAAAFATPATYQVNGKQYVVLACGGTKLGTKKGNQYVAFALP